MALANPMRVVRLIGEQQGKKNEDRHPNLTPIHLEKEIDSDFLTD